MSVKKKNKLYNKFCLVKDPKKRKENHYKKYRNIIANPHKNKQGETLQKSFLAK